MVNTTQLFNKNIKWKPVVSIIYSTLALVVFYYQEVISDRLFSGLLFFLAIPMLIILYVFREKPDNYGFQLGNWKRGLVYVVIGCLFVSLILWFAVDLPGISDYYSPQAESRLPYPLSTAIELLDWEFFFRGFLIFSLAEICGPYAIFLQAVPFTLAHFGKPYIETVSCIFGGVAFGAIAWKTRSFVYPYLIHVFLATLVIYLASR